MVTVGATPAENSKTFGRKPVRVRPPLPAPFKSDICSADSVRSAVFPVHGTTADLARPSARSRGQAVSFVLLRLQDTSESGDERKLSALTVLRFGSFEPKPTGAKIAMSPLTSRQFGSEAPPGKARRSSSVSTSLT